MTEITRCDIVKKAIEKIEKGYYGKAIVGFIDILGFSDEIITRWNKKDANPLWRIMNIKAFSLLAKEVVNYHKLYDYDEETLVGQAPYPDVITLSDSFVLIQKMENENDDAYIMALLAITFSIIELWRLTIDEGFTFRGGIEYGDLFYSKEEIIGPSFIEAYRLESKVADNSRIVYSNNICKNIHLIIKGLPAILQDYLLRFFRIDEDNCIILNPVMITEDNAEHTELAIHKLKEMLEKSSNDPEKRKYRPLIDRLIAQDRTKMNFDDFMKPLN